MWAFVHAAQAMPDETMDNLTAFPFKCASAREPFSAKRIIGETANEQGMVHRRRRVGRRHRVSGLCGRPGEDRHHLSVDRQRGERRPVGKGRRASGRRDRQHRASRTEGLAAWPHRRVAQSRRRADRTRRGRPPRQSAGRPAADVAPDHAGPRGGHARLIPFFGVAGGDRRGRAAGHALPGRRLGGVEHHRPRLQMDVPHHPDRARLSPRPMPSSSPT